MLKKVSKTLISSIILSAFLLLYIGLLSNIPKGLHERQHQREATKRSESIETLAPRSILITNNQRLKEPKILEKEAQKNFTILKKSIKIEIGESNKTTQDKKTQGEVYIGPMKNSHRPYRTTPLITGTGRTGTHSVSISLIQAGLDIQHENVAGKHGTVSWLHIMNDTEYYFEKGKGKKERKRGILFKPIVQVVRHPLNTIRSISNCFCANGDIEREGPYDIMSWKFLCRHIHCPEGSHLLRAANYWYYWNLYIENIGPQMRIQIERFGDSVEDMLDLFARYYPKEPAYQNQNITQRFHVSRNGGKSPEYKTKLTWEELEKEDYELTQKIKEMAKRYGYPV